MSTAPTYQPPSEAELAREIRQYAPKMLLYNAGDEWFRLTHNAKDYWMPPDLDGKLTRHPVSGEMVPGDGMLGVSNSYGRVQHLVTLKFTGGYDVIPGADVTAIVRYAMSQYGHRGVVWLRGDQTDAARKAAAKALYRNYRKAWAEQQVDARAATVANFRRLPMNANRPDPRPSDKQRKAQKLLDSIAEEGRIAYEFVCPHGCTDFEAFEEYRRHMKVNHNQVVKAAQDDEPDETDETDETDEPDLPISKKAKKSK